MYLGGNTSVLDIRTVSTSRDRLLVIKDSFANCFVPFLAPYYREIVVVDPRYYSGDDNRSYGHVPDHGRAVPVQREYIFYR